ncbi:hypothetical protein NUW54_g13347 [Trametes sanguinea]|uniref:Uncharacterized protein n=1 Tax=Trametes sanguinea TaxID=158606 RepID=A0ACC1MLW5_9APHY|nr:hypothetical protein NUW54_g13347 [Trametes sanguinea]
MPKYHRAANDRPATVFGRENGVAVAIRMEPACSAANGGVGAEEPLPFISEARFRLAGLSGSPARSMTRSRAAGCLASSPTYAARHASPFDTASMQVLNRSVLYRGVAMPITAQNCVYSGEMTLGEVTLDFEAMSKCAWGGFGACLCLTDVLGARNITATQMPCILLYNEAAGRDVNNNPAGSQLRHDLSQVAEDRLEEYCGLVQDRGTFPAEASTEAAVTGHALLDGTRGRSNPR